MCSRKVYITGQIDDAAYTHFSSELDRLIADNPTKNVHIDLCSEGGHPNSGLAIAGKIRAAPCTFTVTVYGQASSAASLILAAGDVRRMSQYAWVMVHTSSGKLKGDAETLLAAAKQWEREELHWAGLLAQNTSTPSSTWLALEKKTTYLDAEQCLALGLIDEILKERHR